MSADDARRYEHRLAHMGDQPFSLDDFLAGIDTATPTRAECLGALKRDHRLNRLHTAAGEPARWRRATLTAKPRAAAPATTRDAPKNGLTGIFATTNLAHAGACHA